MRWLWALSFVAACGGGDDDGSAPPDPEHVCSDTVLTGDGGDAILGFDGDDVEVPTVDAPTQALVLEALDLCRESIGSYQAGVAPACDASEAHTTALTTAIDDFAAQLGDAPDLPGLDRTLSFGTSIDPGGPIAVFACANDPSGRNHTLNAFALPDSLFMLQTLMDAVAEGAAYWDLVREQAGGDEQAVDDEALVGGLAGIYHNHANGFPWQFLSRDEASDRLLASEFALEIYLGGVAFILFHEAGHANLQHSLVNHVAGAGIVLLLEEAGYTPTDAEEAEIEAALRTLQIATEAQADIYGATALRRAGHTTRGPASFFIGVVGATAIMCDEAGAPDVEACVDAQLSATHPSIDVRATILRRVVRDGEDLTCLLDPDALTP